MEKSDFYNKIEVIREKLNLKQKEIAEKIGLNYNHYNDMQRKAGKISNQTIMIACLVFNLRKEWIENLDDKGDPFLSKEEVDSQQIGVRELNKKSIELLRLIRKREGTEELIHIILDIPTEDNKFIKEFLNRLKKMAKSKS